jgi:thiosulfate/3-mercaptopyruvate sulfurtransferase
MHFTTLISPAELAANLERPDLVVFDCRHELTNPEFGPKAYAESHLPNARFAHVDRDLSSAPTGRNGRHPLPDAAAFAGWLGRMGVDNDTQVVGYDSAGGVYGSRLWWMLRWLGHDRVAVLDGGWDAWTRAGLPVTSAVPTPVAKRFVAKPRPVTVDAAFVMTHLDSGDMTIVDARSNDRYHGQNETIDPVAGHIPGALNRFFKHNLDDSGRFKQPKALREDFAAVLAGVPPEQVVHQCGSGVSACHNLLAMEIAGLPGSRLYPGSWSEWVSDPARPVAT